jgi:hypothetical protein
MKKLVSRIWPFLHALLGFIVVGSLGRAVFAMCVPFSADSLMCGPTPYTNSWPTEYAFMMIFAGVPGVFYAAAVAAATESKRKAALIMATAYALVAVEIVSVVAYSSSRGVFFYPSLSPAAAITTLGGLFLVGTCVAIFTQGFSRKNRQLFTALLVLVSLIAIAITPSGMRVWHNASLRRIRPGLRSLDPQGDEHYLLRVRCAEDKHALLQLDYVDTLDFVPREGTTKSMESNLWEEIRSNLGDAAYADAVWTTTGAELPHVVGGMPEETPLFRIWDRPRRAQYWTHLAQQHGMEPLADQRGQRPRQGDVP